MEYPQILENISSHFQKKIPFALYSLPESDEVNVCFQNDNELYKTIDFMDKVFVFSPFNFNDEAFCIPAKKSKDYCLKYPREIIEQFVLNVKEKNSEKKKYSRLIEDAISKIRSKKASKIVVSRNKEFLVKALDIQHLISRILNLYPAAFRYVWYHPKTGLWCGASPEVLVKTEGAEFTTMALAGTQKHNEEEQPKWTFKEIEEQQMVVDAISTSLQRATSVVKISKTYNYRAASLVHLRTDITGILSKGKTTLSKIISTLHPTPAVCGTPQKFVKRYILNNEGYDREFYAGFLGPICENECCSKLFVNLRCMKILNNTAILFVGGGITASSQPEAEWQETQHKLETMLQVLRPML